MRIAFVVAVSRNGVIGRGGGLAWKISDDLKRFRALTIGKPVIMGRKTYDSIGHPLSGRANIVVSRSMPHTAGVLVARSIDEALRLAEEAARGLGSDEIAIIGGADIFRELLARADRIYLTEIEAAVEGDVFFPRLEPAAWTKRRVGRSERSARNEHSCEYFVLDRR